MTKIQMTETLQELFMSLEHCGLRLENITNFEFVSDFEFCASDFVINS